ncbi:MAG TPA: hypothetical protein VKK79_07985 [Candidatus Lokiarchaeia archaeon]|nr:hypothetical protein [Candidatus Lokiarchaeia archaeon]
MAVPLQALKPAERWYIGPPPFYAPQFTIPQFTVGDVQLVRSPAGRALLEEWLSKIDLQNATEWVNYLYYFTLSAHFDRKFYWDTRAKMLRQTYNCFCEANLAEKFPIALYWTSALAPILYYDAKDDEPGRELVALVGDIIQHGDSVSRGSAASILSLLRFERVSGQAAEILEQVLRDPGLNVRAEAILSLIKLGIIPKSAEKHLETNLNYSLTFIPAASALFHMTRKEEHFNLIREEGEGDDLTAAQAAAYALDPWPTRQCAELNCHHPLSFQDFWLTMRRHFYPNTRFQEAYLMWADESIDFTCNACGGACGSQVTEKGCKCMQVKK